MRMEVELAENSPLGKAGQRVTLSLTPTDVQITTEIPTYLAGYRPGGFRAEQASPEALVDKSVGSYRSFNSDDAFVPSVVKGSLQGAITEVDPNSSTANFAVVERYIGSFMPTQTMAEATYDLRATAGRKCRNKLDLDLEIDVLGSGGLLCTASNWNAEVRTAIAGGSEWDVSGNPIEDLQIADEKSYQQVTDIWMNKHVGNAFLRHEEVKSHMRQMLGDSQADRSAQSINRAGVDVDIDLVIPGLPVIHICAAKKKSGPGGTMGYIMPNVVVLTSRFPGIPTTGQEIQTCLTFRRRGDAGVGWETREFFIDGRGPKGGTMLVTYVGDVPVMTSNVSGGIITNVVAA